MANSCEDHSSTNTQQVPSDTERERDVVCKWLNATIPLGNLQSAFITLFVCDKHRHYLIYFALHVFWPLALNANLLNSCLRFQRSFFHMRNLLQGCYGCVNSVGYAMPHTTFEHRISTTFPALLWHA